MPQSIPKLRTRKPTSVVPYPLVLLEGEEKGGKTFEAARFSGSPHVGTTYWLELGEDSADEYGAVEGADYELIEHDGTYRDIMGQVEAVHAESKRAAAAGEKPVVLVIDSGSQFWRMLVNWTQDRARRSNTGQNTLKYDPDAEIKPGMNLWNDGAERWHRLMYFLRTMPGIVVLIARGKEVQALDGAGNPIPKTKTWRVEGHKSLAFDATVWVRMLRGDNSAYVVGARSLKLKVPREGKPLRVPDFSLEKLIFQMMGCKQHAEPQPTPQLVGDLAQPLIEKVEKTSKEEGLVGLKKLWKTVGEDESLSRDEITAIRAAMEREAAALANPPKLDDPTSDAARLRAAAAEEQQERERDPFGDDPTAAA
ncbi:AAA family ATPase [Streptomyces sp. NPDC020799]|uniref:AAA family ATPase n=1 Tax=Streptomyces sp. NPDC020799 TaxID=3365091 RepID=UPI0034715D1B